MKPLLPFYRLGIDVSKRVLAYAQKPGPKAVVSAAATSEAAPGVADGLKEARWAPLSKFLADKIAVWKFSGAASR